MKRFIAVAAILAAYWQPAHAQMIVGSIPEEFQGDWCWQENTDGEQVFRPGACKPKASSLSIDRTTLDRGQCINMLLQLFDRGERCAVKRSALEDGKPSLNPIEP